MRGCNNGLDDDGDGLTDAADPGPADPSESCLDHAECPSGVCPATGDCAAEATVSYVDVGVCSSGAQNGDRTDPYCTLSEALASTQPIILLGAGTYLEQIELTGDAEIYGMPGAFIGDDNNICDAISIHSGARVVLSGLTVGTGENKQGGLTVEDADTTLIMQDCEIGPSFCTGVDGREDTSVHLVRNYIHENQDGGVNMNDVKTFQIINNMVVQNGNAANNFGGCSLKAKEPSLFINNTIADNIALGNNDNVPGGVVCKDTLGVPTIALINSILWGNTPGLNSGLQYSPVCVPSYCVLESSTAVPTTNYSTDPAFIAGGAAGADNYHLQGSSVCINNGTAADAPADDFDGELRDSSPDIGADEVL